MKILFLLGKLGSGKDTAADYICDNYNFEKYRYADFLKDILNFSGWDNNKDIKGRRLLQEVGSAFRNWDEDFFVKYLANQIITYIKKFNDSSDLPNIIIGDTRHINEIEKMKEILNKELLDYNIEYITLRIQGSNFNNIREINSEIVSDISETNLDDYETDYTIFNCKFTKLEDLYERLDEFVSIIFNETVVRD